MQKLIEKASVLAEALPYIQTFRDSMFVVKFGGSVMEDPALIKRTMRDIVLLEAIGIKPVVVHGGGKAITARLKELNIPTKFINGLRHTCDKTIEVVDDVLHNVTNKSLVDGILEIGGRGRQVSGKDMLKSERMYTKCAETGAQLDIGFVGDVVEVDTIPVLNAFWDGHIPVIAPLGRDANGQVYNINADIAACKIAEALKARKLVFLSDVPGILSDPKDEKSVISSIKTSEVEGLISSGVISGGMIPKVQSCIHAIQHGTEKVHMIDGRVTHSLLLEIFTDKGIGTEIFNA